jgi:hypothetical protein
MTVKRMNYFTHQLLHEQDFKDEQTYHVEMRRRHNRIFHSWGVVEGLEVRQHGEHEITIDPGMALDRSGREIILFESATRDLSSFSHNSDAYITIGYLDQMDEVDHLSAGGIEGYTRITETAEIHERRHDHLDEDALVLARVRLSDHGHIEHIDMAPSVRKVAREVASPVAGWMRLPFKPVRLNPVKIGSHLAAGSDSSEYDFIVDEARAYCGERGARGSMQIPVPPGATHVSGFRLAGETRGEVRVRLFRTGWNLADGKGEQSILLEETLMNGSFHKHVDVKSSLDESQALAVSIKAEGESEIWLVAVRFG